MTREIEIKLRIANVEKLRVALKKLGARPAFGGTSRVHEWNVLFDTHAQDIASRGQLLRIRTETPGQGTRKGRGAAERRVLLTFKRPPAADDNAARDISRLQRHKVREEFELEVGDANALETIFEALGMRGWFRYEKFRTTFRLPATKAWSKGLLIELDETPIGTFLELEGPPNAIDRAAGELGFSKRDYIVLNYLTLYLEECQRRGETPSHMVFPKKK
jgi:adenylate cyclase, class 2